MAGRGLRLFLGLPPLLDHAAMPVDDSARLTLGPRRIPFRHLLETQQQRPVDGIGGSGRPADRRRAVGTEDPPDLFKAFCRGFGEGDHARHRDTHFRFAAGPLLPPPDLPPLANLTHRCPPTFGPADVAASGRSAATVDEKHGAARAFGRRGSETQNAINPSKPRPAHKPRPVFCGAYLIPLISYRGLRVHLSLVCAIPYSVAVIRQSKWIQIDRLIDSADGPCCGNWYSSWLTTRTRQNTRITHPLDTLICHTWRLSVWPIFTRTLFDPSGALTLTARQSLKLCERPGFRERPFQTLPTARRTGAFWRTPLA